MQESLRLAVVTSHSTSSCTLQLFFVRCPTTCCHVLFRHARAMPHINMPCMHVFLHNPVALPASYPVPNKPANLAKHCATNSAQPTHATKYSRSLVLSDASRR